MDWNSLADSFRKQSKAFMLVAGLSFIFGVALQAFLSLYAQLFVVMIVIGFGYLLAQKAGWVK